MAGAKTSEVFACTPEQFRSIVVDYPNYPQFLGEVKECRILKEEGERKLVEYSVSMVKSFKYSLWMTEKADRISWEFASGDIFKTMAGAWTFKDEGGKCRATYEVEATFSLLVPGPIAKALVNVNLPNMIASYHRRVKELFG